MAFLRLVQQGTTTDTRQRCYFDVRLASDSVTPATGEAGGQPQVSIDGAAWSSTGIGVLVHAGNGRYYADLTDAMVQAGTSGRVILTRYKGATTLDTPGTTMLVVTYDPYANSVTGGVVGDITGTLSGNVGGNIVGNLNGSVSGNVGGNVIGSVLGDLGGSVQGGVLGSSGVTIADGAIASASFAAGAITSAALATDTNVMSAVVKYNRDQADTRDRYVVMFTMNGVEIAGGSVTGSVSLSVGVVGGSALIAPVAMTLHADATYYYEATGASRLGPGDDAKATVTATIAGVARSFTAIIGRDSA